MRAHGEFVSPRHLGLRAPTPPILLQSAPLPNLLIQRRRLIAPGNCKKKNKLCPRAHCISSIHTVSSSYSHLDLSRNGYEGVSEKSILQVLFFCDSDLADFSLYRNHYKSIWSQDSAKFSKFIAKAEITILKRHYHNPKH